LSGPGFTAVNDAVEIILVIIVVEVAREDADGVVKEVGLFEVFAAVFIFSVKQTSNVYPLDVSIRLQHLLEGLSGKHRIQLMEYYRGRDACELARRISVKVRRDAGLIDFRNGDEKVAIGGQCSEVGGAAGAKNVVGALFPIQQQ
jgi:hypothetical protein